MVKPIEPQITSPLLSMARAGIGAAAAVAAVKTAQTVNKQYHQRVIEEVTRGGSPNVAQTAMTNTTNALGDLSARGCQVWCCSTIAEGAITTVQLFGSIFGMENKKVAFLN